MRIQWFPKSLLQTKSQDLSIFNSNFNEMRIDNLPFESNFLLELEPYVIVNIKILLYQYLVENASSSMLHY